MELQKRKFFKFTDEMPSDIQLNEEKLQRDILVSKLLKDESMRIEAKFERNNLDKISTNIYLLFSTEARKILANSQNSEANSDYTNNINFMNLYGFDANKLKDADITKKEIIGLCNRYIGFGDCKD